MVIEGEVEITAPLQTQAAGGPGVLFGLAPQERHEVTRDRTRGSCCCSPRGPVTVIPAR